MTRRKFSLYLPDRPHYLLGFRSGKTGFSDGLRMRVALHLYSDPSVSLASTRRWGFYIHCPTEDLCSGSDSLGPSQMQPPNQGLAPGFVMDLLGIGNTMAQTGLFTLQATGGTALWAFEKPFYLQTA